MGVYGLGRFGFFWASLLSSYFDVKGYSRSVARKTPEGVDRVSEDKILQAPALFICVSISSLQSVFQRIGHRIMPGTLVIDTCSVKVYPVRLMQKLLPQTVEIIATHPIFGPDSAKNGVKGLPLIYWPIRAKDEVVLYWKQFFISLGLRVIKMSPGAHDREAAFTQGITHYIGRVIADLGLENSTIGTVGYNKLLGITEQTCNDPWQLFLDLQHFNPYTQEMRNKLHESLDRIMSKLETLDNIDNKRCKIHDENGGTDDGGENSGTR